MPWVSCAGNTCFFTTNTSVTSRFARYLEKTGQFEMLTLHERIAKALGWTVAEAQSFSLPTLRELVRPVSPKLALLITDAMQDKSYFFREES